MGHDMVECKKCGNFVFYKDNWNIGANTCEDCTPVKDGKVIAKYVDDLRMADCGAHAVSILNSAPEHLREDILKAYREDNR